MRFRAASVSSTRAASTSARFVSRSKSGSGISLFQSLDSFADLDVGRCLRAALDKFEFAVAQLLANRNPVGNAIRSASLNFTPGRSSRSSSSVSSPPPGIRDIAFSAASRWLGSAKLTGVITTVKARSTPAWRCHPYRETTQPYRTISVRCRFRTEPMIGAASSRPRLKTRNPIGIRISVSEFENMPDLDCLLNFQRLPHVACRRHPPRLAENRNIRRKILPRSDIFQVMIVFIRACDHISPPIERSSARTRTSPSRRRGQANLDRADQS